MVDLGPLGPQQHQSVVLLHGEPGAGKDTVAQILVDLYGYTRFAFADRLKEMCEALDPMISEAGLRLSRVVGPLGMGWDYAKRRYPEVRRIQQRLATEVIRRFVDADYFANVVHDEIVKLGSGPAVVTDLRFQAELDVFALPWAAGPFPFDVRVWWVKRPDNPHRLAGENAAHVSETWHPAEGSYEELVNDGTIEELSGRVADMMMPTRGGGGGGRWHAR